MAGLKTLAKELQSKGRNGDTILAHINPQEAGILKTLGGSGTRNPDTGLPEYNIFKKAANIVRQPVQAITQGATQAVKAVQNIPGIKQVSDVSTQAFRPIDQALVGLDKTVGKTIPGGWGTLGMAAASFIPGAQFLPGGALGGLGLTKTAAMTGLGALTGSGVLRPGKSFNLQGAVMGGAAAYGSTKLADYAAAAGGADTGSTALAKQGGSYTLPGGADLVTEPPLGVMDSISQYAGDVGRSITSKGSDLVTEPSMYDRLASSFGSTGGASDATFKNLSNLTDAGYADVVSPAAMPPAPSVTDKIADFGKSYVQNVKDVGSGLKNLVSEPGAAKAATAATGINPMQAAGAALYGGTGIMALDEQEKLLEESKRANAISQAEYDKALGEINRQRDYAAEVVSKNQFNPNPSRDVSIGETFYRRGDEGENLYSRAPTSGSTLYAMGGQVDDELGGDYSAMGMDQGNMQKGLFGMGYAAGGMPRFLSGGGDGMSDSIKATINDNQPARLADGEFVIPADVVSHLGNGSSKAGAKQLYSMMDKIRKARTGNPKQGKQINPRKYLPA